MKDSKLFILIIALLIACCGPGPDDENGKIAFTGGADGGDQVFTMEVDGSNQTQITHDMNHIWYLAWSPDGSKLAFIGQAEFNVPETIYTIDPDGSNRIQITDLNKILMHCDWSPDGEKIAFIGWDEDAEPKIYVVYSDGSDLVSIYTQINYQACSENDNLGIISNVDWSADGTKLLSVMFDDDCHTQIFVMDDDGDNVTYLTSDDQMNSHPTWSPGGSEILYTNADGIMKMDADGSNQVLLATATTNIFDKTPQWSPDGSQIAYFTHSYPEGNDTIWLMNSDGSNRREIINEDKFGYVGFYTNYPWSPDGSKIIFIYCMDYGGSSHDIYTINTDGSGLTNLTNRDHSERYFAWQPPIPPSKLVFNRYTSEGHKEIYKMDSDGTNEVLLTSNELDMNIACSPDGSKIAFLRGRGSNDIWIMNDDGSAQTSITDGLTIHGKPVWSIDGSTIAFTTLEDSKYKIYTVQSDGSELRRLTDQTGNSGGFPSWHPDGSKIAFFSGRDGNNEIYLMNADGSDHSNLTNSRTGSDIKPKWSPDGSKIAFISNRNDLWDVFVMNADGSDQINISNSTASKDAHFSWSPDGSKIAFQSDRDGNKEIYISNADGSGLYNLTNHPADDGGDPANPLAPLWSEDGSYIIFSSNRNNNRDLYKIYLDGTGLTRLTDNSQGDYDPNWLVF